MHKTESDQHTPATYAAYSKNLAVRMNSSSGGLFTLIAEHILNADGVVFGAAFDEQFKVVHVAVENKKDLFRLRSSKYVQSEIGDAYKQTEDYLKNGRQVLFTGTPCQIGGLRKYLGMEYTNLVLQDIICHGVPSPKVWHKYINYRIQQEGKGSSPDSVTFRSKAGGWQRYSVKIAFANGRVYEKLKREDTYMRAFLNDICLRPSCYNCRFKTLARDSDITLADYWGIQAQHPEMDDDKGTSLVMVHSKKGAMIFDSLKEQIYYKEVDVAEAISNNQSALKAAVWNAKRQEFFLDMDSNEFDALIEKYCKDKISLKEFMRIVLLKLGLLNVVRNAMGRGIEEKNIH